MDWLLGKSKNPLSSGPGPVKSNNPFYGMVPPTNTATPQSGINPLYGVKQESNAKTRKLAETAYQIFRHILGSTPYEQIDPFIRKYYSDQFDEEDINILIDKVQKFVGKQTAGRRKKRFRQSRRRQSRQSRQSRRRQSRSRRS